MHFSRLSFFLFLFTISCQNIESPTQERLDVKENTSTKKEQKRSFTYDFKSDSVPFIDVDSGFNDFTESQLITWFLSIREVDTLFFGEHKIKFLDTIYLGENYEKWAIFKCQIGENGAFPGDYHDYVIFYSANRNKVFILPFVYFNPIRSVKDQPITMIGGCIQGRRFGYYYVFELTKNSIVKIFDSLESCAEENGMVVSITESRCYEFEPKFLHCKNIDVNNNISATPIRVNWIKTM